MTEQTSGLSATEIINLETYPIHDRDSPARAELIERCRLELATKLCCSIPELVRPAALGVMAEEATRLLPAAYHNNSLRNCYLHQQPEPELEENHPRNMQDRSSVQMIAYDQLPSPSPLKTFYHSDDIRDLVADIIGAPALFDNEDPYQPANYVCYKEGDESSWHFDSDSSFTMTLMVQPAEHGGEFQMSPNTRTDDDQNYDRVGAVLRGEVNDSIVSVGREPGALCIFRGCDSLHRVSPAHGATMRIMGVFVYESEPGILGDPKVNSTIYGPRVMSGG